MPKLKNSNAIFLGIFKHCVVVLMFQVQFPSHSLLQSLRAAFLPLFLPRLRKKYLLNWLLSCKALLFQKLHSFIDLAVQTPKAGRCHFQNFRKMHFFFYDFTFLCESSDNLHSVWKKMKNVSFFQLRHIGRILNTVLHSR